MSGTHLTLLISALYAHSAVAHSGRRLAQRLDAYEQGVGHTRRRLCPHNKKCTDGYQLWDVYASFKLQFGEHKLKMPQFCEGGRMPCKKCKRTEHRQVRELLKQL